MNICYHYYTIKTLLIKSGFTEDEAQTAACYSQMVDDFILSSRVILKQTPPDFFIENGLAVKLKNGNWVLQLCPTGINVVKSISHNYQRHTLTPFHFIVSKPLPDLEVEEGFNRINYRCVRADDSDELLINKIMKFAADKVRESRCEKNLMRLGMALHTYADTYAHCNFSGFHGYENESVIKKAYNKFKKENAVCDLEILFFKELPSIGHGNVGTVPDICSLEIEYAMKSSVKSSLDYKVVRCNTDSFAQCSRRILNLLCSLNQQPLFDDDKWNELENKLTQAQYVSRDNSKEYEKSFCNVFPEIKYHFDKNSEFSIKLRAERNENVLFSDDFSEINGTADEPALHDPFSPQGDSARSCCAVYLEEFDKKLFDYAELAYERVKDVVGEYTANGTLECMDSLCTYLNENEVELNG